MEYLELVKTYTEIQNSLNIIHQNLTYTCTSNQMNIEHNYFKEIDKTLLS